MSKKKNKKLVFTQDKIELEENPKVEFVKERPTKKTSKNISVKSIVYKGK